MDYASILLMRRRRLQQQQFPFDFVMTPDSFTNASGYVGYLNRPWEEKGSISLEPFGANTLLGFSTSTSFVTNISVSVAGNATGWFSQVAGIDVGSGTPVFMPLEYAVYDGDEERTLASFTKPEVSWGFDVGVPTPISFVKV